MEEYGEQDFSIVAEELFGALRNNDFAKVEDIISSSDFTSEDLHNHGIFDVTRDELDKLIACGLRIDDYTARGFIDLERNDLYDILVKKTDAMPIDSFRRCHGRPRCVQTLMDLHFKPDISDLPSFCADNLNFLKYAFAEGALPRKELYAKSPFYSDHFRDTMVNNCIYDACRTHSFDILTFLFAQKNHDGTPIFKWNSISEMIGGDPTAVYMLFIHVLNNPESLENITQYPKINLSRIDDVMYGLNTCRLTSDVRENIRREINKLNQV